MGRLSTPAAVKRLTGNPGKRKIKPEPKPKGNGPAAPSTLSKEALAVWTRTVWAQADGVFTQVDENALVIYCEAVVEHQVATRQIEENGYLAEGSQGQLVPSPWVKLRADAARRVLAYQVRLGFDPMARVNLNAVEAAPEGDDGVE